MKFPLLEFLWPQQFFGTEPDKVSLIGFGTFSVSERAARGPQSQEWGNHPDPGRQSRQAKAGKKIAEAVK